MKTPVNSQGHLEHLHSHAAWKGVGVCEGEVEKHFFYVYLLIRRYTPHSEYSVSISVCIGMSVYISSFVYNCSKKKPQTSSLQKRDSFQATQFLPICSVHSLT